MANIVLINGDIWITLNYPYMGIKRWINFKGVVIVFIQYAAISIDILDRYE